MNVTIKGKGHLVLSKSDFVAAGGEGSVYCKGKIAYKIYADPKKMIPVPKIGELAVLSLPNIVKPEDVVLDSKGSPIGYSMAYVKDTYSLCQLFPKVFRDRFRIAPPTIISLVKDLQDIVVHCHQHDILIVDLNEMNFLMGDKFDGIYAIDCDSWQTKSYHATAIMDSIRDRHATGPGDRYNPTKLTDWFSFAIVSFQMHIGIHPFKGKHPTLKSIDERMLNNVSILNKEVSIPPVCQPLSNIPQAYLDWYRAVFEKGQRLPPPTVLQAVIVVQQVVRVAGSKNFTVRKVVEIKDDILGFDPHAHMILTGSGVFSIDGREEFAIPKTANNVALGHSQGGSVVAAWIGVGKLNLHDVTHGQSIDDNVLADSVMSCDGNIFIKSGEKIFEVKAMETGTKFIVGTHLVGRVAANSTKMYEGIVIQDLLGACYASIFPKSKHCYQIHLKDLDGWRIIDAKYQGQVAVIVAFRGGKYDKFLFRFNDDFDKFDVRVEQDVGASASINFTVIPGTGVCISLNEKEELEIFLNALASGRIKVFDDPMLSSDMRIMRDGTQAMFSKGGHLYNFEVKKTP